MHVSGQPQDGFEPSAATTTLPRSLSTFLYGRRLYQTMPHWETNPALANQSDLTADFATAWQAADKVVDDHHRLGNSVIHLRYRIPT